MPMPANAPRMPLPNKEVGEFAKPVPAQKPSKNVQAPAKEDTSSLSFDQVMERMRQDGQKKLE